MPDDRPLHEVLLEYAVYVPIGLAASVAEQLPDLTAKGRRLAGTRIHLARLMGEFAVGHAQRRLGQIMSSNGRPTGRGEPPDPAPGPPSRHGPESVAGEALSQEGSTPDTTPPVVVMTGEASPGASTVSAPRRPGRPRGAPSPLIVEDVVVAETPLPPGNLGVPAVESLAIPAYDTLAASQVVQRLSSLEPDELEAVRRYEVGTRGRRTILHRVAQLNAAGGRPTL